MCIPLRRLPLPGRWPYARTELPLHSCPARQAANQQLTSAAYRNQRHSLGVASLRYSKPQSRVLPPAAPAAAPSPAPAPAPVLDATVTFTGYVPGSPGLVMQVICMITHRYNGLDKSEFESTEG